MLEQVQLSPANLLCRIAHARPNQGYAACASCFMAGIFPEVFLCVKELELCSSVGSAAWAAHCFAGRWGPWGAHINATGLGWGMLEARGWPKRCLWTLNVVLSPAPFIYIYIQSWLLKVFCKCDQIKGKIHWEIKVH
jgi:hypothetical protein